MTSDLEREFYQDCADKKRAAYGIHNKNRAGKGVVRLPSDYLSKKELKELMNSAVLTEDLSLPMPLASFRKLSAANKRTQLEIWGNVYGHTATVIGAVLGTCHSTGYYLLQKAGLTESFKEKYAEEKKNPEKRKEQKLRFAKALGIDAVPTPQPVKDILEDETENDIPACENAVERRTEPSTANALAECPAQNDKSGNLSLQVSGRGDLIKMMMDAYLAQIDSQKSYVVQMTFCEL